MSFRRVILLLGSTILMACGAGSPTSQLDGHYEESDEAQMQIYEYAQVASAEYEPSRGVIVGLGLVLTRRKIELIKELLKATETVWVTVPALDPDTLEQYQWLRDELGEDGKRLKPIKHAVQGPISLWARDWAPQGAKAQDGSLRLLDFNYYPGSTADDATPRSILTQLPASRVSVPVYNEGGNFMNNRRGVCMMTTRVSRANSRAEAVLADDQVLDDAQIKSYYERFAGCRQTHIFPSMPHEVTGHIDMWAKFLDDDTVIVNEILSETRDIANSQAEGDRLVVSSIQEYLNQRAKEIEELGFKVIRIPMPAPVGRVMRSYTNSLTLNGTALIPRYLKMSTKELRAVLLD